MFQKDSFQSSDLAPFTCSVDAGAMPAPPLVLFNHRGLFIKLTYPENAKASVNGQDRGGVCIAAVFAPLLSESRVFPLGVP